jgi:hypothetical protein
MAAERRRRAAGGFALFAIVIGIVVVSIIALLMMAPASGDNKQERIQRTADILHRLVAEMDSASGSMVNYFKGHMQKSSGVTADKPKWPGRLSQLYTQPIGTDTLCVGTTFTSNGITLTNWRGPYHLVPIRKTGHRITPGFVANDTVFRVSDTEAYIRISSVALDDAKALDLTVDKVANAAAGAVRYSPTGSTPTVVEYHFTSASGKTCG